MDSVVLATFFIKSSWLGEGGGDQWEKWHLAQTLKPCDAELGFAGLACLREKMDLVCDPCLSAPLLLN